MIANPRKQVPPCPRRFLLGDKGIAEVTRSLCEVNVANAEAYDPRDEKKVKDTIQESVGFQVGTSQNTKPDPG